MSTPIPAYMRVRSHIVNLITHCDGKNLRIPGENDLCRLFDVTRPTVRTALEGLIAKNYLIPRRGIGTFINPEKLEEEIIHRQVIGVVRGDGMNVYAPIPADVSKLIEINGFSYLPFFMPSSGKPDRLVEMVKAELDAVIWWIPGEDNDYLNAIQEAEVPLLVMGEKEYWGYDYISCVTQGSVGQLLADYFCKNNHREFLYVHTSGSLDIHLEENSWFSIFCRNVKERCGLSFTPETSIVLYKDFPEKMKQLATQGEPLPLVYSLANAIPAMFRALEKEDISVPPEMSFITYGEGAENFFQNNPYAYIDLYSGMKKPFYEWCNLKVISKKSSERFQYDSVPEIVEVRTQSD